MKKIVLLLLLAVCFFAILCGCEKETKYYAGEKVSPDDIARYSEKIFDETADPIIETGVYYWTPDGGKYHIFRDCSSLANAKTVLSGTLEEGMAAGKSGLCKTCEKRISN